MKKKILSTQVCPVRLGRGCKSPEDNLQGRLPQPSPQIFYKEQQPSCSQVNSSENKKRGVAPPWLWGQANLLPAPSVTPTSLGHRVRNWGPFLSLWNFLFLCVEHEDKISSWVNGRNLVLKKWRARDSLPRSSFHVAFVPLAQLTVPGSPLCILMKGDETG